MIYAVVSIFFATTVAVFYELTKQNSIARYFATSAGLIIAFITGAYIGASLQIVKDYENYVFPFSRYSTRLSVLVGRGDVSNVTNDIVVFNSEFNKSQSAKDVANAYNRIFNDGDTNR